MPSVRSTMDALSRGVLLPVMLLLNYALFQHLAFIYARRWRELAVQQLLFAAVLGFATLVSFAQDDLRVVRHLNDVSEDCVQLTFLLQIKIVGHDVLAKTKLKTRLQRRIRAFMLVANVLIVLDWLTIALNLAVVAGIPHHVGITAFNNVLETSTLVFVLVFRFYYLSLASSWRAVRQDRKHELALFAVFAMHEVPFAVLEAATSIDWDYVQGVCMRALLAACVLASRAHHQNARANSSGKTRERRLSTRGRRRSRSSFSLMLGNRSSASRYEESNLLGTAHLLRVKQLGSTARGSDGSIKKVVAAIEPTHVNLLRLGGNDALQM